MKTLFRTLLHIGYFVLLINISEIPAQGYYSLHFDGVNDYVGDMNENIISGSMPFTIEAWVKYESGGGFYSIINRGIRTNWVYNMYGIVNFGIYVEEPPQYLTELLQFDQWFHIAGVRANNGYLYLFINGFKTDSVFVGYINLISNSTPLWFGTYFEPGGGFKGKMTRIRISKIDRYINNFTPTTTYINDENTVGLWKFEEGGGAILQDASGNNINGTIFGGAQWSTDIPIIPEDEHWESDILITDNDGLGASNILTFGQDSTATDSIDISFGEYELPPVPPAGVFDSRFNLPTIPQIGTLTDLRNYSDTNIVWTMTFQPSAAGYPITFD
jgi:hypothetical protein